MKITDFAVYKNDGTYWTPAEVQLIAASMGDTIPTGTLNSLQQRMRYVYKEPNGIGVFVFPWRNQNITRLTPIEYNDYLKLIKPTTDNLKPGTKVKIVDKWTDKTNQNREGKMDDWLGKTVTINYNFGNYNIKETTDWNFNIHCFQCLVQPEIDENYKSTNSIIEGNKMTREINTILSPRAVGKSLMATALAEMLSDDIFKCMTSKPRGKYLSLKIKNGVANARSLIYQAESTGINDPRPYIQEIIAAEKKALKQKIVDLNLYTVSYGYNIKLASLIECGKILQKAVYENPSVEMGLKDCIAMYKLLDELTILDVVITRAEETRTAYECPYKWIAKFLTAENLNVPKEKVLFDSNKLTITLKNGWLKLNNHREIYKIDIKLDVKTGTYYI